MIRGALFTIGALLMLGCGAVGVLSLLADGMSDNPVAADSDGTPLACGVGFLVGVAMIVGAFFVPAG